MSNSTAEISLLNKIASYTEILAKDAHSTAFVPLSEAYRQMGMLDDALEVAEKGIEALPRFAPGFVALGRIQFERGDMAAALTTFEAAVTIDDACLPAIKGLARTLVRLGHHQRARTVLDQGASIDPNDALIKKMLADLPPSSDQISPNVKLEPAKIKEPIATSTIAEIYLQQGFPERALKVYRDLLACHPDNTELKVKIAEISREMQQQAEVAEDSADNQVVKLPVTSVHAASSRFNADLEPSPPTLEVGGASGAERQLEDMNRWLAAIRVRRQDVLQ